MRGRIRAAVLAATALSMLIASTGTALAGQPSSSSFRDARAAAMASGGNGVAVNGGAGIAATWFTGTIAAGGTQGWTWTNAPANAAYVVGYNPVGATTSSMCQFETISSQYVQLWGGQRQFQFVLKNAGSISCGATVLLTAVASGVVGSTGGVSPGGSQVHYWTNLPWNTNWVASLNPTGATSSAACQFRVTRSWYVQQQQAPSSRQFWWEVKNVGTIACQADLRLASTTVVASFSVATVAPGVTWSPTWTNANPLTSAYLVGVSPQGTYPTPCQFEVTRMIYRQRINTNGSSERQIQISFKNVGAVTCGGLAELQTIAA
jgi:hypothetical protein